jgi:hypothetical protein
LRVTSQVDNHLGVAVRQESVKAVRGGDSVKIDEILDEMVEREDWFVSAKNHLCGDIF